jgi:hypothetical protein
MSRFAWFAHPIRLVTPNPDGVDIVDPALQYKSYFRFLSSASESDRVLVLFSTLHCGGL